ncbi:MAG: EAL domain-containing protein [Actinomycetota bacterium]|nr:EAL domain-containing protein [Actinomycetota bacterium]
MSTPAPSFRGIGQARRPPDDAGPPAGDVRAVPAAVLSAVLSGGLPAAACAVAEGPGGGWLVPALLGALGLALYGLWRRGRLVQRLRHRSLHDSLTGLPNRALLRARLRECLPRETFALLLLDLDGFKAVNDSRGHSAGDDLLVECGRRLRARLRAGDTVARLGGDEFAVVLPDLDAHQARVVATDLVAALSAPVPLRGHTVSVGASVGVATGRPGATVDDLLAEADVAMYAAKGAGRGRVEVYREHLRAASVRHYELEDDLRSALDGAGVDVHYQPIFALESGRMIGVEALARWSSPRHGQVSPLEFIGIAEQSDLIARLGAGVLEQACGQAAAWIASGLDLRVGVNLSPRQLADDEVVETVGAALRRTGLDPARLVLEVTESLLVDDDAVRRLVRLHEQGVRIAVDDFGTGYSSLSYLRRLPLDIVKLDRSFVQGMAADRGQQALVDGILLVCKRLGLDVVAEGIETDAERGALLARGCRIGQGFLLARPAAAPGLSRALASAGHLVAA